MAVPKKRQPLPQNQPSEEKKNQTRRSKAGYQAAADIFGSSDIIVKGAREHNLDHVDLTLPRNRLICFTGVSGSGKSSLAFDTLYAEGQRRYIESLSSYARQFLGQLPKPDVDQISGLSPAISISQKTSGQNSRSTVGTITEIHDFLRVLYARVSTGYCPQCGRPVEAQTRDQILNQLETLPENSVFIILAPVIRGQKGEYRDLFADLKKKGYRRARVDGAIALLDDNLQLDRQMRHSIEVVIDRIVLSAAGRSRLAEAVEAALIIGKGEMIVLLESTGNKTDTPRPEDMADETNGEDETAGTDAAKTTDADSSSQAALKSASKAASSGSGKSVRGRKPKSLAKKAPPAPKEESGPKELFFSSEYACPHCHISFPPPTPQLFSFNSPQGMCPHCQGLGFIHSFDRHLLIPDPSRSFQQGCIVPLGKWKDLGRWKRHIYQGVADTLARRDGLDKNFILETAWEELPEKYQDALLLGTGDLHITYTWRNGPSGYKWGGPYEGIIPKMLQQYRETGSKLQRLAMEKYMSVTACDYCKGDRLNDQARSYKLETESDAPAFREKKILSLPEICRLPISDLIEFFGKIKLSPTNQKIAREALKEIRARLGFLKNVGLEYLSLGRSAPTLSGGEMQRIRLAGQIGSGLNGVLYVLDEPSIGLHARDNLRLIETLRHLRNIGNTVVVVEHDEDTMLASDYLVDFGPGPGVQGGQIVACGSVADVLRASQPSLTARYLNGSEAIEIPNERKPVSEKKLVVRGATHNNLKNIDVEIPLGMMVCVTGVSGSGKSSLVNDILVEALNRDLNHGGGEPGAHRAIEGIENLDKLIAIDQSPIGRTPRSNPATYIKLFDDIRKLFAELPAAKAKGFQPGRFSFNVSGGRCEACEGNGAQKLEMDFLADLWIQCPVCEGERFNKETLSVTFKGHSINDVLEMDVQEALTYFEHFPKIAHKLRTLADVGLGYMKLGQPSPTLSGGEAQRIKLARELVKKSTGKTLYLLDEPTTGLHFADIRLLLGVLRRFVDAGNTVLVVEHNLDVIKTADWIIDLGPEGGAGGGEIVAVGTPEDLIANPASYTGRSLKEHLEKDRQSFMIPAGSLTGSDSQASETKDKGKGRGKGKKTPVSAASESLTALASLSQKTEIKGDAELEEDTLKAQKAILIRGAREHNLQNISLEIPRGAMTVCSGQSGSGKTSLAMDTVYAEGQRRFVESLSSYARQFLGQLQKPNVDQVLGVSPAIAIQQKAASHSPRSTVGTVTEIHDYLRILFARLGVAYCPDCDIPIGTQSTDEIIEKVLAALDKGPLMIAAPLTVEVGDEFAKHWEKLRSQGFLRVRIDGVFYRLDEVPAIDRRRRHRVEVIVDRMMPRSSETERADSTDEEKRLRSRAAGSVETALAMGKGEIHLIPSDADPNADDDGTIILSQHLSCERCGRSFERLSAHHFSFNSPLGWCPHCEGLGTEYGANPANFIKDPKLSLEEGVISLGAENDPQLRGILTAFCRQTHIPTDVPFEQLDARFRRLLFQGTGERWFDCRSDDLADNSTPQNAGSKNSTRKDSTQKSVPRDEKDVLFRFQYKGIYPAIDEAARLVPALRSRYEFQMEETECSVCLGSRLRDDAAAVRFHGMTMDQINRMPLSSLLEFFQNYQPDERENQIAGDLIREIQRRLEFLVDVGLDYLTLSRSAVTLSGGESQRIRLAAQIGSGLTGVLYVLDEPTIGLHPRDNARLIGAIEKLRDLGNTVLLVEHDKQVIESADYLLDFGPKSGHLGGEVVAAGKPSEVAKNQNSVTGPYLSGTKAIPIPINRRILR